MRRSIQHELNLVLERLLWCAAATVPLDISIEGWAFALCTRAGAPLADVGGSTIDRLLVSMVENGVLEFDGDEIEYRFERLHRDNKRLIRGRQLELGWNDRGWACLTPTNRASLLPPLQMHELPPISQDALGILVAQGHVTPEIRPDGVYISEHDYIACHPASLEQPWRPIAEFVGDIDMFEALSCAQSDGRVALQVRNGQPCIAYEQFVASAPHGGSRARWELASKANAECRSKLAQWN